MSGPYRKDTGRFVVTELKARAFWRRQDLRDRPFASMADVADELERAGLKVFAVHCDAVECEPRPAAIWEILTGCPCNLAMDEVYGTEPEERGAGLRRLQELGISPGGLAHQVRPTAGDATRS